MQDSSRSIHKSGRLVFGSIVVYEDHNLLRLSLQNLPIKYNLIHIYPIAFHSHSKRASRLPKSPCFVIPLHASGHKAFAGPVAGLQELNRFTISRILQRSPKFESRCLSHRWWQNEHTITLRSSHLRLPTIVYYYPSLPSGFTAYVTSMGALLDAIALW